MSWDSLRIFFKLYVRPLAAMSDAIDKGSLLFGLVAVAVLSLAFQQFVGQRLYETYQERNPWEAYMEANYPGPIMPNTQLSAKEIEALENGDADLDAKRPSGIPVSRDGKQEMPLLETGSFVFRGMQQLPVVGYKYGRWLFSFAPAGLFSALIGLTVFYVPGLILLASLMGLTGSFGVTLRRDFGTLWSCVLLAWAAAHMPFLLAAWAVRNRPEAPELFFILWLASSLYFGFLVLCALRAVFGLDYGPACLLVALSWLPLMLGGNIFKVISPFMFSPFILYYLWMYFRGDAGDMSYSYRQKQDFRRFLDNATVNPRDADAHYQLGIIYLQRRQTEEAFKRFTSAVEIDPQEIDARYELGRLCRERGKLPEAIEHFGVVVAQDAKYAQHEIWREVGATYLAAGMHQEAKENLERYVENRPFDPEGLYHLGQTLLTLGAKGEARDAFNRCIEAVQTMPYYRRHLVRRWRKMAQAQLSAARA